MPHPDYHPEDRFANATPVPASQDELDRAAELIHEVDDACHMRLLRPVSVRRVPEGCWLEVWLWVPNVIFHRDEEE